MKRDFDLENLLRDKVVIGIKIDFEYYLSEDNNQIECIILKLQDLQHKVISLALINPIKFDCYLPDLKSKNLDFLKCFVSDNYTICLDPYDEHINKITNNDNFIIEFESYKLLNV